MPWLKYDKYGQELYPGDICVRDNRGKIELIIYRKESWGGKNSKGEWGNFETLDGATSVKFSSVVFVCDPMGTRKIDTPSSRELTRKFYEGKKN